jgi:hypothetical protein
MLLLRPLLVQLAVLLCTEVCSCVWIGCCFLQLQCANEAGQRWRGLAALHAAGVAAAAARTRVAELASNLATARLLHRPMLLLRWRL